jgi:hypothetical protein
MTQITTAIFPALVILLDIVIAIVCVKRISKDTHFNYFSRDIWIILVIFGSFLGQIMYFIMERTRIER